MTLGTPLVRLPVAGLHVAVRHLCGATRATNPNDTQRDNYSATGNVNPYTGAVGTRNPPY